MENSAKCIETVKYKCECYNIFLCESHLKKHILMPCDQSSHTKINSKPSSDEIKILKLSINKFLNNLLLLKQQIISDCINEITRIKNHLASIIKEISEVSKILTEKLSKQKFSLNELSNINGLDNISFDIKPSLKDTGERFKRLEKFFEQTSKIKKWKELEKHMCGFYDSTCWYCNKLSWNVYYGIENICSECYEKMQSSYYQDLNNMSSLQIYKCGFNGCDNSAVEYRCSNHIYCSYHLEGSSWEECYQCTCSYCKMQNCYISNFVENICSECYEKNQSICCQDVEKIDNEISFQISKCGFNGCDDYSVQYRCSKHLYSTHYLEDSSWEVCYQCICSYCKSQGCYINNGIDNICSECYLKTKCIYCQEFGKNQFNECGHYFCDTHSYPLYFCFCKKCLRCGGDWVKTRSCFHEFECTCESKQLCLNCIKNDNEKHSSSDQKNDAYQTLNIDTNFVYPLCGINFSKSVKISDSYLEVNEEKQNKVINEREKIINKGQQNFNKRQNVRPSSIDIKRIKKKIFNK